MVAEESKLDVYLKQARDLGASDLHLEAGGSAFIRVRGELRALGTIRPSHQELSNGVESWLGSVRWSEFLERKSADFSKTVAGTRVRIHAAQTVKGMTVSLRLLSSFRNSIADCNLHPDFKALLSRRSGLILVSGATGSGKSTTLAALIEEVNQSSRKNVVTLEQPIEYYFHNRQSFIRQREVGTHTPSFAQGIQDAMREDPDVLMIGEMRDPEVMRLTLHAAETGHLVLATVHSATCVEALQRLAMSFAPEVQGAVRTQLADALVAVICQRLVPVPAFGGLAPLCEVLVASTGVRTSIRSGQFSQIASQLQTGANEGMWTFDRYARWMEQKKDWVRPSQATALQQDPATESVPFKKKSPAVTSDSTSTVEVAEELDLEALAKKIADETK